MNSIITLLMAIIFLTIGLSLNYMHTEPLIQIYLLIIFTLISMYYFKFEIFHPFVWLTPFIIIYNISVIMLDILDIRNTDISNQLMLGIYLSVSAMFFYYVFFSKRKYNKNVSIKKIHPISFKLLYTLFIALNLIIVLNLIIFLKSGMISKSELSLSGGGLNLGYIYQLYIFISFFLISQKLILENKFPKKLLYTVVITVLLISLVLGERESLFSFVLLSIYLFYIIRKPKKVYIYLLGFLSIFLIPIFGALKNVATLGLNDRFSNMNLAIKIFQGEFLSAGRNFELLIHRHNEWDFFYGQTLIWDFFRSIIPSFIYYIQNSVAWFNKTFLPDVVAQGRGHGFSLLAEGYINFGYIGIFIWYFILAFIIDILYKNFDKNLFRFSLYLYMIPTIIYIQRADFSNLFSPLLKHGLIFILLLRIGNYIYKKRKRDA